MFTIPPQQSHEVVTIIPSLGLLRTRCLLPSSARAYLYEGKTFLGEKHDVLRLKPFGRRKSLYLITNKEHEIPVTVNTETQSGTPCTITLNLTGRIFENVPLLHYAVSKTRNITVSDLSLYLQERLEKSLSSLPFTKWELESHDAQQYVNNVSSSVFSELGMKTGMILNVESISLKRDRGYLIIDGKCITDSENGNGWEWDMENNVLTLNGYSSTPIHTDGNLTIHLKENSVNSINTKEKTCLSVCGDLHITGPGTLTLNTEGKTHPVYAVQAGSLTIDNCSINAAITGIGHVIVSDLDVVISNTQLFASASGDDSSSIVVNHTVQLKDSSLSFKSTNGYAILCNKLEVSDCEKIRVIASGSKIAISCAFEKIPQNVKILAGLSPENLSEWPHLVCEPLLYLTSKK